MVPEGGGSGDFGVTLPGMAVVSTGCSGRWSTGMRPAGWGAAAPGAGVTGAACCCLLSSTRPMGGPAVVARAGGAASTSAQPSNVRDTDRLGAIGAEVRSAPAPVNQDETWFGGGSLRACP